MRPCATSRAFPLPVCSLIPLFPCSSVPCSFSAVWNSDPTVDASARDRAAGISLAQPVSGGSVVTRRAACVTCHRGGRESPVSLKPVDWLHEEIMEISRLFLQNPHKPSFAEPPHENHRCGSVDLLYHSPCIYWQLDSIRGTNMASDLAEDLQELRRLLGEAQQPRVQALLSTEITNLEKQHAAEEERLKSTAEEKLLNEPAPVEKKPAARSIYYTTLSTFSWEEESEKVKIYISLEGATQEKALVDFQVDSINLKVHDVNGKNYQFSVPKLKKNIVPSASKVLVKPKRVILTLKKADVGSWYELTKKEDKIKPPSFDKDADPMAGLMGLMKNMYEDGDDEMRKTIAKAWTDARSGKPGAGSNPALDSF